jgi:phosphoribosyl 1,2-cyclic phosphate phosphodiesterase
MRVHFLGTAGAIATPRPGCDCELCVLAREKGPPYRRNGPSVFVHGPDILVDTPEEARLIVDEAGIKNISAGLYSHWHPDHTRGMRMWETRNADWRHWPKQPETTPIYLPAQVAADFEERIGLGEAFRFMEEHGYVSMHVIPEGKTVAIGGAKVQPIQLADPSVYAFLLRQQREGTDGETRVLIAMDELVGWDPPDWLCAMKLDLAVLPVGIFEFDPFTGERRIPAEHGVLTFEATWRQTLAMARKLDARHTVFAHIEEPDGNTPEALERLQDQVRDSSLFVTFAWDGLVVDVQ